MSTRANSVLFVALAAVVAVALCAAIRESTSVPARIPAVRAAAELTALRTDFVDPVAARSSLAQAVASLNGQHARRLVGVCPLDLPSAVELSYPDGAVGRVSLLLVARGNHLVRVTRRDANATPSSTSHDHLIAAVAPLLLGN